MGRLFWKFFLFIWLAQAAGMVGVGAIFWWKHHHQPVLAARGMPPPDGVRLPPPPEMPERGFDHPPPRPHEDHPPGFIPIEPLIANILVTLICAFGLAWYFSKPIRNLRSAFDAAADGDLNVRLSPAMGHRRDELSDLGRDFDRMAQQLQALMNAQRHLLHDVSHELRSPLARLQAAVGIARQSPEKMTLLMDRIELESTRINELVGELLTLSRLETGMQGAMDEDIAVDELLDTLVENARFEAGIRGIEVGLAGDSRVVVQGKAELLYSAIENIVRNAIKYSPDHGLVSLLAHYDEPRQCLRLTIEDNGPGVPESELQRIFEPFFRSSNVGKADGHGLGLAIAQRVVTAHGGKLCASNRPDGGFRIDIELPAQRASLPGFTAP
jgi:signal transduction histidine kinase